MWEFVIQQNSALTNQERSVLLIDQLPPGTVIFNEHQPLLGHVETEVTRADVPFHFHTFHINANTVAVRVKNSGGTSRFITTTIEKGSGYELVPRSTPGVNFSELFGDGVEPKGVDFQIEPHQEAEVWIQYKCHEETDGKVMEVIFEMISNGELDRKFYFLYLRGKQKKLKKVGEKFIKSCDEFWECEAITDPDALRRRIFFMKATSVDD